MAVSWTMDHNCATCEYWGGQRKVHSDARVVDWSGSGVCAGQNRTYRGKQISGGIHPGGGSCWECWRCLRE